MTEILEIMPIKQRETMCLTLTFVNFPPYKCFHESIEQGNEMAIDCYLERRIYDRRLVISGSCVRR